MRTRVIPVILIKNGNVVKTRRFKSPAYIGDPINIVKLFNDKEVDELIILDISAKKSSVNFDLLADIAGEAFMPLTYGGGINTISQVESILRLGYEKISFNNALFRNTDLVKEAGLRFGAQSIVASVDAFHIGFQNYYCVRNPNSMIRYNNLTGHIKSLKQLPVGEILLTSVDKEGVFEGYDLNLISRVSANVEIPVIACGGAGVIEDFAQAIAAGACAVAAGSLFIYIAKNQGILVNYPHRSELEGLLP